MRIDRKAMNVSEGLHSDLKTWSENTGLPMTVIIETLLLQADSVDWEAVKKTYSGQRPTWKNIRSTIEKYTEDDPTLTDEDLVNLTGYSLAQVETVTHTAHKRCLAILMKSRGLKPKSLSVKAGVSEKFAKRIWEQQQGVSRIPKQEQYLWDTVKTR